LRQYYLNKTRSKSISIGFDAATAFGPCIQLHKNGFPTIRLSIVEWEIIKSLKHQVDENFIATEYLENIFPIGLNALLSTQMRNNTRLILIEKTFPSHTNKIRKPAILWLSESSWENLFNPCIQLSIERACQQHPEVNRVFESLGYSVKIEFGELTQKSVGDISALSQAIKQYNIKHLIYESKIDVERILEEMKMLCVTQLCEFIRYESSGLFIKNS